MEPQYQYPRTSENKLPPSRRSLTQEVGIIITRLSKINPLAPAEFLLFFPFDGCKLPYCLANQYSYRACLVPLSSSFSFQERRVGSIPDQRLVLGPLFVHALHFRQKKAQTKRGILSTGKSCNEKLTKKNPWIKNERSTQSKENESEKRVKKFYRPCPFVTQRMHLTSAALCHETNYGNWSPVKSPGNSRI